MKVIVLTGLVSVEKAQLSQALAHHFSSEQSVMIIDNIARLAIESDDAAKNIVLHRIEGDLTKKLPEVLHELTTDVTIITVSEQTHPEKLFVALDDLREQAPNWEIYSLALIDTRTCDCFPNVREALESYADVSIMMPYQLEDVVSYVTTA